MTSGVGLPISLRDRRADPAWRKPGAEAAGREHKFFLGSAAPGSMSRDPQRRRRQNTPTLDLFRKLFKKQTDNVRKATGSRFGARDGRQKNWSICRMVGFHSAKNALVFFCSDQAER
jgi:hypothetical protein